MAPAAPSTAAEARACAVIGCRQPHRSMGYCAAHYQKRRIMVSTGRLHAAWVEDAAPHTLPDVFFARKRPSDVEVPSPKPSVTPAPRMWVRKKRQAPLGNVPPGALAVSPPAEGMQPPSQRLSASPPASSTDKESATTSAQRWASEFLAQRRAPTSQEKGFRPR
ncbi:cell wall protein [Corallococcus sp. H22C18031201]|nr:cell wall protein [Corallococcus sp. H22C18031201]